MNRRSILLGMAALPAAVWAAAPSQPGRAGVEGGPDPSPWKTVNSPKDANRVIEFFHFSCSYCRQMDDAFANWGQSIPRSFTFEKVPVCFRREDAIAAMAFYTVRDIAPDKLSAFTSTLFYLTQSLGWDLGDSNTYREAVRQAGVDRMKFNEFIGRPQIAQAAQRAADLTRQYKIEQTPSLGIAGKYLIHAGFTNGNYEMLIKLANGLVSQQMSGG